VYESSSRYARPDGGDQASVPSLTRDSVVGFYGKRYSPNGMTVIVAGDVQPREIEKLAASVLGDWRGNVVVAPSVADEPARRSHAVHIVSKSDAPQSELRIGHVAVPRDTPDYHALLVANTILGGQFVSRINLNLREDKGFTYGARTASEFRRLPGPFVLQVSVQTSATAQAIHESIAEIVGMRGPRPVTADELGLGVAALTRGYARNFETADQIARAVMQLALFDLPDDYFAEFVPAVVRVTADDVSRVMARHVDPARLTTLVVGDLDVVQGDLAALGLGDPVVLPADAF
jgi:predicted Zn-dependent peptidase